MASAIKVHVAGNVFEGTVFAIDPVTKSIVLSELRVPDRSLGSLA